MGESHFTHNHNHTNLIRINLTLLCISISILTLCSARFVDETPNNIVDQRRNRLAPWVCPGQAHCRGALKTNSYHEELCLLFAASQYKEGSSSTIYGANTPDVFAVSLWEGRGNRTVEGAIIWDGADTKEAQFPIERFLPQLMSETRSPSAFEATAARISVPVRGQYLVIDHTMAAMAQDIYGHQYQIGVVPSKPPPGSSLEANICLLYISPPNEMYGSASFAQRVPFLQNGAPISVIFSWPVGNNYVYSNVCFQEDWFWSGSDVDIDVHDSTLQKPTSAPPAEQVSSRWPPTFSLYGGSSRHVDGRN